MAREQAMVYRHGELPPGLEGCQPRWEVVNAVIGAQQTLQVKVDLMRDFVLLAVLGSAATNTVGGFRMQMYDKSKNRKLQERGTQFPNMGGSSAGAFFLREPYHFDVPRSQLLIVLQNMETVENTVQLALYGVAAPFEGTLSNER